MAEFRKLLFAFALLALLLGTGTANAQYTCGTATPSNFIVTSAGVTEIVGDLLVTCTPNVIVASGGTVTITVTLNTRITNRLLGNGYSDALLIIDNPWPTGLTRSMQDTGYAGGYTSVGTFPTEGASGYTVYTARQTGINEVEWDGVPIDPPGTSGVTVLHFINVRGDADFALFGHHPRAVQDDRCSDRLAFHTIPSPNNRHIVLYPLRV